MIRSHLDRCRGCGAVVVRRVHGTMHGPSEHNEPHLAPCGLPCLSGGVGHEVIRPMRADGKSLRDVTRTADMCPRCRTPAEIVKARIDRIGADARADVRAEVDHEEAMERQGAALDEDMAGIEMELERRTARSIHDVNVARAVAAELASDWQREQARPAKAPRKPGDGEVPAERFGPRDRGGR